MKLNKSKIIKIMRHKLTGDLVALYSAHATRFLFPMITVPYLARVLGVSVWGAFAFIQAYGGFLAQLIEFGFGLSGTREVARQRESSDKLSSIISNVLGAQLLLAIVGMGITILIYRWIPLLFQNPTALWLGVAAALTQGFNLVWYFRGLELMRLVATIGVLTRTIALVMIFTSVHNPNDIWKVFLAYLIGNTTSLAISIIIACYRIRLCLPTVNGILKTLKDSWTLFLVRAGANVFNNGSIFIVGLFVSSTNVGYYSGALKIITALRGLLSPAVDAMYPKFSYMAEHAPQKAIRQIRKVLVVMSGFGLVLTAFAFFGAAPLVNFLLGAGFEPSIRVLQILSLIPFIAAINHTLGSQWMVPFGLDRQFATIAISAGVFSLISIATVVNMIPIAPHEGASYAVLFTQILLTFTYYFVLRIKRMDPFFGAGEFIKPNVD
jgi:PST family polysaccharide transporter